MTGKGRSGHIKPGQTTPCQQVGSGQIRRRDSIGSHHQKKEKRRRRKGDGERENRKSEQKYRIDFDSKLQRRWATVPAPATCSKRATFFSTPFINMRALESKCTISNRLSTSIRLVHTGSDKPPPNGLAHQSTARMRARGFSADSTGREELHSCRNRGRKRCEPLEPRRWLVLDPKRIMVCANELQP